MVITIQKTLNTGLAHIVRLFFLLMLLMFTQALYAAQIKVSVTPQTVGLDEAFELTFTVTGQSDGVPDFAPLNKDFEVLGQRQSSQSSWTNGQTSQSVSWLLNLMARKPGEILIPAIKFGGDASEPLKVVIEPGASSVDQAQAMLLKVAVSPENPYVQSQILYTWQFFRRADIELRNARLSEPQVENAVRVQLGENRQFVTKIDDVEYVVTEGRYAVFPQQSGVLRILPLVLTAEVLDGDARNNNRGLFRFQRSTTRRVTSEATEVQVQAIPPSYPVSSWLAAQQLELTEKWSDESLQLEVGASLTRTINLRAAGVLKSQLPALEAGLNIDGLTAYVDQPLLAEQDFSEGVSALREQKVAIIASRAGHYTLPPIDIPWFNTQTGQMEVAHLASRSLTVIDVPGQHSVDDVDQSGVALNDPPGAFPQQGPEASEGQWEDELLWKILSALLATGWVLSMVIMKNGYRKTQAEDKAKLPDDTTSRKFRSELKAACYDNDARAARQALLGWCRLHYQTDTLNAMHPYCSERLQRQIGLLEQALYASSTMQWSGDKLWLAFKEGLTRRAVLNEAETPLVPLYPPENWR